MLTTLGIVLFAIGLMGSIALHEIGHLVPAKRFGVKVTQYMVGFGPTIWSRRRGETEYGIKGIPLGGYIRMIGMFPPKPGDEPGQLRSVRTGAFASLVADARRVSLEEVTPGDEERVFYKLPVHQRVVIMMGGPTMNLLLAVLFLGIAFSGVGEPRTERTTTVYAVSACATPTGSDGGCSASDAPSPAAAAGLREDDRIVEFAGRPIASWTALQEIIRAQPAGPVEVVVERDGARVTETVPLVRQARQLTEDDPTLVEVGFLGVTPDAEVAGMDRVPLTALPGRVWDGFTGTASAIIDVPSRMAGVWDAAFGGGEREIDGPIGVVGASRIGGEVAAAPELPLEAKVYSFIALLGSVNMALFVFNLVPLLPLDGGHVAGALYEGARRQVARLRHRADPGPFDVARLLPVAYGVAILLIGMSALLLYADLVNPVTLRG